MTDQAAVPLIAETCETCKGTGRNQNITKQVVRLKLSRRTLRGLLSKHAAEAFVRKRLVCSACNGTGNKRHVEQ